MVRRQGIERQMKLATIAVTIPFSGLTPDAIAKAIAS
jgi:hypothetical protein